ncbi:MAG: response regulator [Desulfobacterales bacterium]|nr:response regulator [Desulfobacterales bacterium]
MRELSECSILVVDDTEANIDVLVEILGDMYDVCVAMNGYSALEEVQTNLPDLILLDIMMPGIDGYEVCRRLKSDVKTRHIPVIFITALGEVKDETLGLELGAVDYITKPISPPIVKARVKNHLALKLALEDLEQQNQILQENVRLREEMERIGRHDLKTPITSIISFPKILLQDTRLEPDHIEMLKAIEKSGYTILNMINLSLDLFKMEKKTYQLQPVGLDLLGVIHKIILDLHSMLEVKGIQLNLLLNDRLVDDQETFGVWGEELLCYSLFANLIKNAVEASPNKETITIFLYREEIDTAGISIHNQGTVPANIRDNFFEKYSTSGKKGGTGLGTYSAKLMAETLGGTISMTTSETSGTAITVKLKPAEIHIHSSENRSQLPDSAAYVDQFPFLKVLVVDDDEYNRIILSRYMKHPNLTIEFAENGQMAIDKFSTGMFDIIFLDMEMPIVSGMDAARHIRQQEKLNPIPEKKLILVALSGHDDSDTCQNCLNIGFNAYLTKPVHSAQIWQILLKYFTDETIDKTNDAIHRFSEKNCGQVEGGRRILNTSPYQVEVDADLEDLIPAFLNDKRVEIGKLPELLAKKDFNSVQKLGHKLKGGFNMYGFDHLGELSAAIEDAAKAKEINVIKNNMDMLDSCLKDIQIKYVQEED